jgi:organic hydroperoxide reductase OsmC/OhrA
VNTGVAAMQISATVTNSPGHHTVSIRTGDKVQLLVVPAKPAGGSGVNGGEFLMLALATCYCNDLYREASRLGISLRHVEVEASATFAGVGLAASGVSYRASVQSTASPEAVTQLLRETDAVAEVHNTLRKGVPVQLLG